MNTWMLHLTTTKLFIFGIPIIITLLYMISLRIFQKKPAAREWEYEINFMGGTLTAIIIGVLSLMVTLYRVFPWYWILPIIIFNGAAFIFLYIPNKNLFLTYLLTMMAPAAFWGAIIQPQIVALIITAIIWVFVDMVIRILKDNSYGRVKIKHILPQVFIRSIRGFRWNYYSISVPVRQLPNGDVEWREDTPPWPADSGAMYGQLWLDIYFSVGYIILGHHSQLCGYIMLLFMNAMPAALMVANESGEDLSFNLAFGWDDCDEAVRWILGIGLPILFLGALIKGCIK